LTIHRKLLESATETLGRVLRFDHPADVVLSNYFHEHHALGQADRAFIADSVFGVLRHKRVLDHLTDSGTGRRLLLAWLARFSNVPLDELRVLLKEPEAAALDELVKADVGDLPPAVQAELPDWVYERLQAAGSAETEILALGRALQEPAPLDLRANTVKTDRDSVLRELGARSLPASATRYSPLCVRLAGKPALNREPLFTDGRVEVQDEGSQLVGYLVAPRRHELVVDFCAGAGGKSLMLGAMMNSQGRLYAFDVSPARLARLKPRLKRSGLSNLHPHQIRSEHDPKIKRLAGKIDRVLVDAPCSGLGTVRRNPDLKWRQSPESVAEMTRKQRSILEAASTLVKPGGRLVYATCSLLMEENEAIVSAFLESRPEFRPLNCAQLLNQHGIALETGEYLRLWPHIHGTDGFFAAALERQG
jgi:16S rRNA (cytosine967-C5)-methyltransferase